MYKNIVVLLCIAQNCTATPPYGIAWSLRYNLDNPESRKDIQGALEEILYSAIDQSDWELAHHLVAAGADPNARRVSCSLYAAAYDGKHEKIKQMLRLGMSIDDYSVNCAAFNGSVPIIKLLLQNGANPDGSLTEPRRPLRIAASNGNIEFFKALLAAGSSAGIAELPIEHVVSEFMTAVQRRELQANDAASAILALGEVPNNEQVIEIIAGIFQTGQREPIWNLSVLLVAFKLKQQGFELLTDDVAPSILDGDWSPLRIASARGFVSSAVESALLHPQFDYVAAHFLLRLAQADPSVDHYGMSSKIRPLLSDVTIALKDVRNPSDFGFQVAQREALLRAEKKVAEALEKRFELPKTISFFRNFYARRFALVATLWRRGLPENVIGYIDQILNGEDGIIDDLLSSSRRFLVQ